MDHTALHYSTFIDDSYENENTRDKTNLSSTSGGMSHFHIGNFNSFLNDETYGTRPDPIVMRIGIQALNFNTTQIQEGKNHSVIERRNIGIRDLSQSENLGYMNSTGYKFKIIMMKLLKMKFNRNICKKILLKAPWELSEEAILTYVVEEILQFQENYPNSSISEDIASYRSNIFTRASTKIDNLKEALSTRTTQVEPTRAGKGKNAEARKERAKTQSEAKKGSEKTEVKEGRNQKTKHNNVIKVSNRVSKLDKTLDLEASQVQHYDLDQLRKKNPEAIVTCNICFEEFPNFQKNTFVEVPTCRHSFCNTCVHNYLQTLIMSSNVLEIRCPEFECSKILSDKDVQFLLKNDDLFSKYQKFKRNSKLRLDSTVRWCNRPGCELFMHGKPEFGLKIICKCGQEMCYECRGEWHEGLNCEEAAEKELGKYAEEAEVQNCPKCFTKIEKNGGCNHILCTQCYYEFCWLCRKQYKSNHYSWWNFGGCPGRQFIDSDMNLSPLTVVKLWWIDFFAQMRDVFSVVFLMILLLVTGPFVYLFICVFAPMSVFNNIYDIGDSGCLIRFFINFGLLLLGLVILPLTILFGLWLIAKRLTRREEINFFMLFYDEFSN